MKSPCEAAGLSDEPEEWVELEKRILGLGEQSVRKNYYSDLQRFRVVLDDVPEGIFVVELSTGLIADLNQAACKRFGITYGETVGRIPVTRVLGAGLEPMFFSEEPEELLTLSLPEPGGGEFPAEVTVRRLTFGGTAYGVLLVRDVSERIRAERALRASEGRFRGIFENAGVGVSLLDAEGRWLRANAVIQRIIGYGEDELLGRSFAEITHPEDRESELAEHERLLRGEVTAYSAEKRYLRRDGTEVWVLVTRSLLPAGDEGAPPIVISIVQEIGKRVRAERALRESEERFRLASQAAKDVIWDWDLATNRVRWNEALGTLLGDPELASGETSLEWWKARIHPEDRSRVTETLHKGALTGSNWKEEYRFLRGKGRYANILDRGMVLRGPDGAPVRMVGAMIDLTARIEAERALQRSEAQFRQLAEALPQLVWMTSPEGHLEYVNARWHELTGRGEPPGRESWSEDLHPEDRDRISGRWDESVRTGKPYEVEYRLRRADGAYRWFLARALPVRDEAGRIVRWFGSSTDIQELREAQERLKESEARFRGVFENAAVGAAISDAEGRLKLVNTWICSLLGYEPEELVGKPCGDFVYEEDRAAEREAEERLSRSEVQSFSLDQRYCRKDGNTVWLNLTSSYLRPRTTEGELEVVSIVQDISARKRFEDELRRAKEAADKANEAKSEFLAKMSHEIRTPMNGIIGMTDLALMEGCSPKAEEFLVLSKHSAKSLLDIVNDILDLSKIEAGRVELLTEPFLLEPAVESVFAAVSFAARQKGLGMHLDIAPDVPGTVVGDEGRLRQVLVNLVGNAVKFTEEGEVEIRVRASNEAAPGRVLLLFAVADTGIGIPEDQLDQVFESFQQVGRSTHPKYGGTGLGLTIAKQLVSLMGGQISVESRVGQGSIFRFTADFGAAPEQKTVPRRSPLRAAPALGVGENGPKLRVLLAEDNPINQLVGAETLRRLGHEVVLACDGKEALQELSKRCVDVVLMDIEMPVLGGIEATKEVREGRVPGCSRDLPIVAVTAHAITGDRERFLGAGLNDYLSKPFDRDQLASVLRRVLAEPRPPERKEAPEARELDRRTYAYLIGPDDVIAFVNEEWLAFATENDAPELTWDRVVGRPLWDFIQGEEVRAAHRDLLQAVRESGERRRLPFRCDSAKTLRWMEMELLPAPGGTVEYRCRVVREEPRSDLRSFARHHAHSPNRVECCSLCRRFLTAAGWVEAHEAAAELGLASERPPRINEGLCPDCGNRMRARLAGSMG